MLVLIMILVYVLIVLVPFLEYFDIRNFKEFV